MNAEAGTHSFRLFPLLRQATAITVSAALIITTTPLPPAWAQMGFGGGGGGGGGGLLGGMGKALNPNAQKEAEPTPPAAPAAPKTEAVRSEPVPVSSGFWIGVDIEKAPEGLEITRVLAGCPAEEAKIKRGDRLTQLNGQPLRSLPPLLSAQIQAAKPAGKPFDLTVQSRGLTHTVPFAPAPADAKPEGLEIEVTDSDELGAELAIEDGALRITETWSGVLPRANLRQGDAILHVDCQAADDPLALELALAELAAGERERITLGVDRRQSGRQLVTLVRAGTAPGKPLEKVLTPPSAGNDRTERATSSRIAPDPATAKESRLQALPEDGISAQSPQPLFDGALPLDPSAVAASLGGNPRAFEAWIYANTDLVPYAKSLKGARGVLQDREGNSLDRALLMREMLAAAGLRTRLARGELPDASVDRLIERLAVTQRAVPLLHAGLVRADTRADRLARDTLDVLVPEVLDVASPGLAEAAALRDSQLRRWREALRDHWWIQAKISGIWQDFDPSLGRSERPPLAETYDDLPAEKRQHIRIAVKAHVERNGVRRELTVLSLTAPASEFAGKPIALETLPLGTVEEEIAPMPEQALRRFAEARAWWPMLSVGAETHAPRFVTFDGEVLEATDANVLAFRGAEEAGLAGGNANALFSLGRALEGLSSGQKNATGRLRGAWVEIEIENPGGPQLLHRRNLFEPDGAEPDLRTRIGFGLARKLRFRAEVTKMTPEALLARMNAVATRAKAILDEGSPEHDTIVAMQRDDPRASIYSFLRWQWSAAQGDVFLGHAQITSGHVAFMERPSGPAAQDVFDIIENGVDVRPGSALNPFEARLAQGVTDTLAEAGVMATPDALPANAAIWHNLVLRGKFGVLVVHQTTSSAPAAFTTDLQAGNIIVAALVDGERDAPFWWRINPETGATLGVDRDGRGAAFLEYLDLAFLVVDVFLWYDCLVGREFTGAAADWYEGLPALAQVPGDALVQSSPVFGQLFGVSSAADLIRQHDTFLIVGPDMSRLPAMQDVTREDYAAGFALRASACTTEAFAMYAFGRAAGGVVIGLLGIVGRRLGGLGVRGGGRLVGATADAATAVTGGARGADEIVGLGNEAAAAAAGWGDDVLAATRPGRGAGDEIAEGATRPGSGAGDEIGEGATRPGGGAGDEIAEGASRPGGGAGDEIAEGATRPGSGAGDEVAEHSGRVGREGGEEANAGRLSGRGVADATDDVADAGRAAGGDGPPPGGRGGSGRPDRAGPREHNGDRFVTPDDLASARRWADQDLPDMRQDRAHRDRWELEEFFDGIQPRPNSDFAPDFVSPDDLASARRWADQDLPDMRQGRAHRDRWELEEFFDEIQPRPNPDFDPNPDLLRDPEYISTVEDAIRQQLLDNYKRTDPGKYYSAMDQVFTDGRIREIAEDIAETVQSEPGWTDVVTLIGNAIAREFGRRPR